MQSRSRFVWPLIAALAIGAGSYFGSVELTHPNVAMAQGTAQTARPTPAPREETVAPASDLSRAFRAVHEAMQDAVVTINISKHPAANEDPQGRVPDELRNMLPPGFQFNFNQPDQVIQGTGSGVIVSADGYILTNNHVVAGADEVEVTLNDGRELKASVVGTDPKTDLAVVRVKADHLTFAKFGDSDALQVGDWVLAFGSPFRFSQTMTQGIISAKGRHLGIIAQHNPDLDPRSTYENFLQTDAAINPGNSGGPLVNLRGEVIGINTAIASNTGAYNGLGFSIPSNDAQYVMHSLIDHGKVVRGYLGVEIEDVNHPAPEDKSLVESIQKEGLNDKTGILVKSVASNGPAADAGLHPGDVITKIDGKSVTTVDALRNEIARTAPNSKVPLSIFHDGKMQEISVTLGTQPESLRAVAEGNQGRAKPAESGGLGVRVSDLDPSTAHRYGLGNDKGAVITNVAPNSLAADVGLQPGDVVTKVNSTDISSAKQFADVIGSSKLNEGVKMEVHSEDGMDRLVFVEKK